MQSPVWISCLDLQSRLPAFPQIETRRRRSFPRPNGYGYAPSFAAVRKAAALAASVALTMGMSDVNEGHVPANRRY